MKPKQSKSLSGLVKIIFLIGLAASPFIFWPWAEIPYEIPRVWFINRWLDILGLTALVSLFGGKRIAVNSKIDGKLLWLVISFFLWAAVTAILGVDPGKSFRGNYYRGDGLFTLAHLMGLFLFTALFWQQSWKKPTFSALAAGSLTVSVWAIVDGTFRGFTGATFGQPNFLAGYLAVALPFVWETLGNKLSKIAVILPIAAIGITGSWGGFIGVVIFFIHFAAKKLSRTAKLTVASGLGIMIMFTGVYFWQTIWSRPYQNRQFVPESRERIFRSILIGVQQRPLTGWGWANIDYAFGANPWPMKFQPDIYLDKAHSAILEVFAATGIIGLTVYFLLIGRGVWLSRRTDVFLPLIVYILYSQTNITSIVVEVIFWLILGIASSSRNSSKAT